MKQSLFTRSFILLLLGQMFSLIGNYTLKFALSMYVLELTGSAEIFGAVLAVAVVPTILLSPLGGILADRVNRRWLMAGLDALSAVAVFLCICFLQAGGGVAAIAGLQIVLGILGAFESPTVQACVPQLHHGDNLLRANALVNQIQSVAGMATPFAGSLAYTAWGIEAVMRAVSICFLLTAFLECWIHLPAVQQKSGQPPFQILRSDLRQSVHFLRREQPVVLQLLLLAAGINFFASGSITVGLPYLVRTDLGLSAAWYGAAESALGLASVLGGVLVTLLAAHLPPRRMPWLLILFGGALLPSAAAFAVRGQTVVCYFVLVAGMAAASLGGSVFSVLGLCAIQQRTPAELTGKVMAFVMTIAQCAQPLGQMLYGWGWERLPAWCVLGMTGAAVLVTAFRSRKIFWNLV